MKCQHKERISPEFKKHREATIKAAKHLFYPNDVILRLEIAVSEGELERIMIAARHKEIEKEDSLV